MDPPSQRDAAGARLGRPLRIALLHPTYWPEVRRGSERLIHDLGSSLADRGHEVTLLTTHRGPSTTTMEDGMRVVRSRRPPELKMLRKYEYHVGNIPGVIWRLRRDRFDLAHAFFAPDAWAAVQARKLGAPPAIFSFHGIPVRQYLVERRYRVEMMKAAIAGAPATTVLSSAAADQFRRYLLTEPRVLPGGALCRRFAVDEPRAAAPTILCAASLGDPFKRADVLFAGFEVLRRRRPDARLLLVRSRDPFLSFSVPALPEGAEWIEADETERLASAYRSAWASVLPSTNEAFGLVLIESLAAGTPVVAARSGSGPEIVADERIGRLFEPDDPDDLASALDEALELGTLPATVAACRARAAVYDWPKVVVRYEELYASVLGDRRAGEE